MGATNYALLVYAAIFVISAQYFSRTDFARNALGIVAIATFLIHCYIMFVFQRAIDKFSTALLDLQDLLQRRGAGWLGVAAQATIILVPNGSYRGAGFRSVGWGRDGGGAGVGRLWQVAQEASDRTKEQWKSILDNIPRGGTDTGAHVKETLSAHAREAQAAMRSSREAGLKVMHTLTQNYATLVSGVLIGLSEALDHGKPKTKH